MASLIDPRSNATSVNELAMSKSIDWLEQNPISRVPIQFRGKKLASRIYPVLSEVVQYPR